MSSNIQETDMTKKYLLLVAMMAAFNANAQEAVASAQPDIMVEPQITTEALPAEVVTIDEKELNCLARNIYFEARGEGIEGMKAVAAVTMNRVKSDRFPNTVCGTVHQRKQFSWVSAGLHKIVDLVSWRKSKEIARSALAGTMVHKVGKALFFHDHTVKPFRRTRVGVIGNHAFYL